MKAKRFGAAVLLMIFLAVCLSACGSPEERKTKFFNTGEQLYKKGEYAKAIINYQNAVQIDPRFALAHQMIGLSQFRLKQWKPAYASLNRAVELNPQLWEAQVALVLCAPPFSAILAASSPWQEPQSAPGTSLG